MKIPRQVWLRFIYLIALALVVALFVLILPHKSKAGVPAIGAPTTSPDIASTTLKKYQKLDFTVPLNATYDNPFRASVTNEVFSDANNTESGYGIILNAIITKPDGTQVTVPGFYDIEYTTPMASNPNSTQDVFAVNSGWSWKIRYAAPEAGTYKYCMVVQDKNGYGYYPAADPRDQTKCSYSSGTQFNVSDSVESTTQHGYVRESKTNPGFFEYDDGTPYVQIGASTDTKEVYAYPLLAQSGINFSRVWLTNGDQQSIFRNLNNKWNSGVSSSETCADPNNPSTCITARGRSNSAARTGKTGYEAKVVTMPSGTKLLSQKNYTGILPSTCYVASAWVKTANFDSSKPFSGSVTFNTQTGGRSPVSKVSSAITSAKDWTQLSVGPFRSPSDAYTLYISTQLAAATTGDIMMDDLTLYQTTESGGSCTSTHAYAPNEVNQIWDNGFEYGSSLGNPSVLYMENLGRFDYIVQQAEKNGIVLQPNIFDYKVWGNNGDTSSWSPFYGEPIGHYKLGTTSPCLYGAATGSEASCVLDAGTYSNFWKTGTNEFENEKYALRYLIARYGYSTAVGFWELTNEMYMIDAAINANAPDHLVWTRTIGDYLKSIDYNSRLITNSYNWGVGDYSAFSDPVRSGMNIYSRHNYIYDETTTSRAGPDEISWIINSFEYYKNSYNFGGTLLTARLLLGGEYGVLSNAGGQHNSHWVNLTQTDGTSYCQPDGTNCDVTGIVYHNSLWSSGMLLGFKDVLSTFSTELLTNSIYGSNWRAQHKGITDFAKKISFRDGNAQILATSDVVAGTRLNDLISGSTISVIQPTSSNSANIRALGRKSGDKAFMWVENSNNTWGDRIQNKQSISNVSGDMTIPGFSANKDFTVTYYNTYNARTTRTATVKSSSSGVIALTSAVSGGAAGIVLGTDTNANNDTDSRPDIAIMIEPVTSTSVPNITLTKFAPSSVTAGSNLVYSIVVENKGTATASSIIVSDPIDVSLVENPVADNGGAYSETDKKVTWTIPSLAAGAKITLSVTVKVISTSSPSNIALNGSTPVTFEAEDARGILAGTMVAVSDSAASGGKYIQSPDGVGNATGSITYTLSVPAAGAYRLFGLGYWPDTGSNSFSVYLDGATTGGITLGNDSPSTGVWPYDWHWVELQSTLSLTAGDHTLKISNREDGARLDKIIMTTDTAYNP